MTKPKLFAAAALLTALAVAPGLAQARSHYRHHHHGYRYWLPYEISNLHNYGPGLLPDSFAYYDGPAATLCAQGAANYFGQDRRRHPCF